MVLPRVFDISVALSINGLHTYFFAGSFWPEVVPLFSCYLHSHWKPLEIIGYFPLFFETLDLHSDLEGE